MAWMLHKTFLERGHESCLAVGHKLSDDPDVVEIDNAGHSQLIHRLKANVAEAMGIQYVSHPGSHRLADAVSSFDVVQAHNLHSDYFDLAALRGFRPVAPIILTMHDMWLLTGHCAHPLGSERWTVGCGSCPDLSIYPAIRRDATRFNLARKRRVLEPAPVAISSPGRWLLELVDRSFLADKPQRWIPNPVDLAVFSPGDPASERRALGLEAGRPVVLFPALFARDSPFKDFKLFVRMIDGLNEGPLRPLGIAFGDPRSHPTAPERLRILPPVSDDGLMARYYRAADVVAYPAKAETSPLGVIEALATGTPLVASAVGGIPEIVSHRRNGLLVPPGDVSGFSTAVEAILNDSVLAASLAEAGLEDVALYDLQRVASLWLDWYGELASERKSWEPHRG